MNLPSYALLAFFALALQYASVAKAQDVIWDFQDGTDQGWAGAFDDNDGDLDLPIVDVNGDGNLWLCISNTGAFADNAGITGDPSFLTAFYAAANDPTNYEVSWDYIIDTSAGTDGTFFELGNFFQSDAAGFPFVRGTNLELDGPALAGADIFTGTQSLQFPSGLTGNAETFARFGFTTNGDASDVTVYLDNIQIRSTATIPEPSSAAFIGFGLLGLTAIRRRK